MLKGARDTIFNLCKGVIILEISLLPYNGQKAASLFQILEFMESINWTLVDIIEKHFVNDPEQGKEFLVQVDVAFVAKQKASWRGITW